jgi:hypothetical protein
MSAHTPHASRFADTPNLFQPMCQKVRAQCAGIKNVKLSHLHATRNNSLTTSYQVDALR